MQLKTKKGRLTRYGLACGYIEKRGTDEANIRLEQICSSGTLRVIASGRWVRASIYCGRDLAAARKAYDSFHLGTAERYAKPIGELLNCWDGAGDLQACIEKLRNL